MPKLLYIISKENHCVTQLDTAGGGLGEAQRLPQCCFAWYLLHVRSIVTLIFMINYRIFAINIC